MNRFYKKICILTLFGLSVFALPAKAQEFDCIDDFNLFLPLIEVGLASFDNRSIKIDSTEYSEYVSKCDEAGISEIVAGNLAIAKFFTSNETNISANFESFTEFANNNHENAMLMLLGYYHLRSARLDIADYYLSVLLDNENATAFLYSALTKIDFSSSNDGLWPEIGEDLLKAVSLGSDDACYFLSAPLQNSRLDLDFERYDLIISNAIEQDRPACLVAKHYLCNRQNDVADLDSNDNTQRRICDGFIRRAAEFNDSVALVLMEWINFKN